MLLLPTGRSVPFLWFSNKTGITYLNTFKWMALAVGIKYFLCGRNGILTCCSHESNFIYVHTITLPLRILSSSFIKKSNLPSLSEAAFFYHSNVIFMLIITEGLADETLTLNKGYYFSPPSRNKVSLISLSLSKFLTT